MKTKKEYNAYQAKYMKERYYKRRKEALKILGDKCSQCGSDQRLEIDHKIAKKKVFDGTRMTSVSRDKFLQELNNCQLLCRKCHTIKTVEIDLNRKMAKGTHGTYSAHRYCKCSLCKEAFNVYMRKWRQRTRSSVVVAVTS